jgi:hypothetical protein
LFYGGSRAPILKTPLEVDADDEIARFFRRVVRNRSQAG